MRKLGQDNISVPEQRCPWSRDVAFRFAWPCNHPQVYFVPFIGQYKMRVITFSEARNSLKQVIDRVVDDADVAYHFPARCAGRGGHVAGYLQ